MFRRNLLWKHIHVLWLILWHILFHILAKFLEKVLYGTSQRCIQDFAKHLRWNFLQKQLTTKNVNYLGRKTPSQMFYRVLNTSLMLSQLENQKKTTKVLPQLTNTSLQTTVQKLGWDDFLQKISIVILNTFLPEFHIPSGNGKRSKLKIKFYILRNCYFQEQQVHQSKNIYFLIPFLMQLLCKLKSPFPHDAAFK